MACTEPDAGTVRRADPVQPMIGVARFKHGVTTVVLGLLVTLGACSRGDVDSPHLARGDTLAAQQKLPEAITEYQTALRDGATVAAGNRLGSTYLRLGQLAQAYDALLDALRADPRNAETRRSLAAIDLILARVDQARDQARAAKTRDSLNATELGLIASTATTAAEVQGAIKELESSLPRVSGALPRLALGSLKWRTNDTVAARQALEAGAAADSTSVAARLLLARFYSSTKNSALADRETKKAADLIPPGSPSRLDAANALVILGQREQAKEFLLEAMSKDPADLASARLVANLQLSDAQLDDASKIISRFASADTSDIEATILSGRLHLARRESEAAVSDFRRALKLAPEVAPISYYLAAALLQSGKGTEAKAALASASALAPQYPEAVFQLAELNLRDGAAGEAREALDRFVADNPTSIKAHVLLGTALNALGRPTEATEAFQQILRIAPNSGEGHYWVGMGLLAEQRVDQARDEFEKALSASPDFREPMVQLVLMDLGARRPDFALRRVRMQLALVPRSADLYDLLGLAFANNSQPDSAETAFLKSIELNAKLLDPHIRLSELYAAMGRADRALSQAEAAKAIDPTNVRGLMALGVAAQQAGDAGKARQAYEEALSLEPRFAGPANNLALLLSNRGDEAGALTFALRAQQLAPDDPHIMDTVGWLLYKKGEYDRAIKNLAESARQLPESPSILYHLGVAAQKVGNTTLARESLERALNSTAPFAEKDDARKALLLIK